MSQLNRIRSTESICPSRQNVVVYIFTLATVSSILQLAHLPRVIELTASGNKSTDQPSSIDLIRVKDPPQEKEKPIVVYDVSNELDWRWSLPDSCVGKEEWLNDIWPHNPDDMEAFCENLPTRHDIEKLYGEEPVIVGLDTCKRYRSIVAKAVQNETIFGPLPRVAGLYNTGTNALAKNFELNLFHISNQGLGFFVPVSLVTFNVDAWTLFDSRFA